MKKRFIIEIEHPKEIKGHIPSLINCVDSLRDCHFDVSWEEVPISDQDPVYENPYRFIP